MKRRSVETILHITSGDVAGENLEKSRIPGEVFVWHDILYEGPRQFGWPDDDALHARARFIEAFTGRGLSAEMVFETLKNQYEKLKKAGDFDRVVLWFDACLFDQSMLCHLLACIRMLKIERAELLCVDRFPGIEPYHGIGQLSPVQLAAVCGGSRPLTESQFVYGERVDRAFADQYPEAFRVLAGEGDAPLPWVPAAVRRWMEEQPDMNTGLGRLETLALEAVRSGCSTAADIYAFVSAGETPPQFWGDTTLWAKVNALAHADPPLVRIEGPGPRLPQWPGRIDIGTFRVYPLKTPAGSARQGFDGR